MLDQNRAADIFAKIRKFSTADEIEAIFHGGQFALTRFANNTIHQNVEEENYVISLRSVFAGRTARSTTNKLDDESLKQLVRSSETLARVQHPDPDLLPMPAPGPGGESIPIRHFPETAAVTPAQRAETVGSMVAVASRHHLTAAGIFSISESAEGIFNSRGLADWYSQTSAEISVTMLADGSSGWQKANSPDGSHLNASDLAETAAKKALDSKSPREIAAGKYTVILEPAAVLDLVGFMFWDFSGLAILDQRSFLNGRVGQRIFGENIDIWDDVFHPLQSGSPFDGEGLRRRRVHLVKNGIVQRLVYARASAEKLKKSEHKDRVGPIEHTGHSFPLPNEMGEAPMNIVFSASQQSKTVGEIIASTERGVLVTRFWYVREVDPYEKILTGMTRDGTFYVEDGKIRHGIRNFRFNESLIHMLSSVDALGVPVRASGEESFDMVVPPLRVLDFNFTEVTTF